MVVQLDTANPPVAFDAVLLRNLAVLWARFDGANAKPSYRESTAYRSGEVPITINTYPAGWAEAITLATYPVTDHPSLSDSVIGVQATLRAKNADRLAIFADDLYNLLHGRRGGMLGLVMALRASGTSVGQDTEERHARTENYYLTMHRPSPNRT